jgi:hypothetical protein
MGTSKPDLKESPIKPKFDPHKKISLSTDAPANSKDFDVTYDAKIGENFCWLLINFLSSAKKDTRIFFASEQE